MSGGQNQAFMTDPAGYASKRIILLPVHGTDGFWGKAQEGPFDLVKVSKSGFPGEVVALTHMTLRSKEQSDRTQPIPGIWIPYEESSKEPKVDAKSSPYFVFTTRLGGCAIGIADPKSAQTKFTHDAEDEKAQAAHLKNFGLKLLTSEYDPVGGTFDDPSKVNVTAFAWWEKGEWHIGRSAIYNAAQDSLAQTLVHPDDKYPKNAGGPA